MSEELRRETLRRIKQVERQVQDLISDVLQSYPADRAHQRNMDNERMVLFGSIEDTLFLAENNTVRTRDRDVQRMHEKQDELMRRQAEAARSRREMYRIREDLQHDRKQLDHEQLLREMDAETGG